MKAHGYLVSRSDGSHSLARTPDIAASHQNAKVTPLFSPAQLANNLAENYPAATDIIAFVRRIGEAQ